PKRLYTVSSSESRATITSGVPSPVKSATTMPGQTRLPLGARHLRLPVAPSRATTSYEPAITSGRPSPSRSATAGEEYQAFMQYGPASQPPYFHISTGALTPGDCARNSLPLNQSANSAKAATVNLGSTTI